MTVLLLKPAPTTTLFGLGPFFLTEPLGLEYLAAELAKEGCGVVVADLRFERRGAVARFLRDHRPAIVGISVVHVLDVPAALALAAAVKACAPGVLVVVGGHAASAYPQAFEEGRHIDAIATGEGEPAITAVARAVARALPLDTVPGLLLHRGDGSFSHTGRAHDPLPLARWALPERRVVDRYRRHYCCLNYMPIWALETARGCEHRCKFCSVWQFNGRSVRHHPVGAVRADFEAVGPNVFVVDDTFWSNPDRSKDLAGALLSSAARKDWMLVQSRADCVVEHPGLLERWRSLARRFDIFFGFEAATASGLASLQKDADIACTLDAIRVARRLDFGVTGNFIIDPDATEEDFEALWEFLRVNELDRVGFTILTPLPGTGYFEMMRERIEVLDWEHYDLHHLVWRPRLPVERFFELYCETWRRSVLNLAGRKKWWQWMREVRPLQVPRLARIMLRTQSLMRPAHYLAATRLACRAAGTDGRGA